MGLHPHGFRVRGQKIRVKPILERHGFLALIAQAGVNDQAAFPNLKCKLHPKGKRILAPGLSVMFQREYQSV